MSKIINFFFIVLLLCIGVSFLHINHVAATSSGYSSMPTTLPDDNYQLLKHGTNQEANGGSDCPENNRCDAGNWGNGDSHQNLIMSNASINDEESVTANGTRFAYGKTMEFYVYTSDRSTNKQIWLDQTAGKIADKYLCGNKINIFYYNSLGIEKLNATRTMPTDPDPDDENVTCKGRKDLPDFSKTFFSEEVYPGTGIYRAKIVLQFDPSKPTNKQYQTRFHISVGNGAKIGYVGWQKDNGGEPTNADFSGPVTNNTHGWINQYPANLSNGNRVEFRFRPQCNIPQGHDFEINWDEVNYHNSTIQPVKPTATLYRYIPGSNSKDEVQTWQSLGYFDEKSPKLLKVEYYAPGQPYSYLMRFENIEGGNGISFKTPFDSANSFFPCPVPTCPGNPSIPADSPGCGESSTALCQIYTHHLPADRAYRFTMYSKNQPYYGSAPVTTAHSRLPDNNDGNSWWASFNNTGEQSHRSGVRQGGSNGSDYTWPYDNAINGPDRLVYIEWWEKGSDGNYHYHGGPNPPHYEITQNCYSANCRIEVDSTIGIANGVEANNPFPWRVIFTNTGSETLKPFIGGQGLNMSSTGDIGFDTPTGPLYSGGTAPIGYQPNAPPDIRSYTIGANLHYGGYSLATCTNPLDVYKQFDIEADAPVINTDFQNPQKFNYSTHATNSGVTIDANATSSLARVGGPAFHSITRSHSYSEAGDAFTDIDNPYPVNYGDQYCANINISPAHGYLGPSGVAPGATPDSNSTCDEVNNKPYVHVFGGDVKAGSGFKEGDSCTPTNPATNGIFTYANKVVGGTDLVASGSGVQIGALSINPAKAIEGFSSGLLRGAGDDPSASTGLTFANNGLSSADIDTITTNARAKLGGKFGGSHCLTNYFADADGMPITATPPIVNLNYGQTGPVGADGLNPHTPDAKYYDVGNGTLDVGNVGDNVIGKGNAVTVYVKGNVRIKGNIAYQDGDWVHPENIPSFRLVVKGNIYIDPGVSRLDGMYVAQPNGASDGEIYSCANNGAPFAVSDLPSHCNSQLVVNGSFVAQKIFLTRAFASLRDSTPGEYLKPGPSKPCGNDGSTNLGDCAAEIFNFSPEMFLSQPASKASKGPNSPTYDYITSLPPVL